ncbi:KAP family P-loop NTPase fold protein [Chryseolinea lacunae]|uniref:KAP NTPase domain-containing protein n=1 Tax=Chryseolinea lacunae TaxID=2801331 RepID=A0ABS1KTJ2_9BACT|nr:hypothetical protein [Chryseolinea lacunae]
MVHFIHRTGKSHPKPNVVVFFIVTSAVYCYYRFTQEVWTFSPLKLLPTIKYCDLLLIAASGNLLLLLNRDKELQQNTASSFLDDEPLGVIKNDELGYSGYSSLVAHKILESHFNKSFAIGINGRWGLGKTSFIDLLKRNLKSPAIIEVNYNPWNSKSPRAIVKDFFDTIQECIRPYHSNLSDVIVSYSEKLVAIDDNAISRSIHTSMAFMTSSESINSLHDEINKTLKNVGKKIVIYIDDLDRLDKEEILEVIRLIRNTANFHNTYFIVAYDKNYLAAALREHNSYNHERFLEKIFQLEISLPYFEKSIFRQKLAERIKGAFPQQYHESIDNEILGTFSMRPTYLDDWLETMRDVTRLTNSLVLNLGRLAGETEFGDFLRIELLRLKYPAAHELLFTRTTEFLETSQRSNDKFTYQLKNLSGENKKSNPKFTNCNSELELFLLKNHSTLSIPKRDIGKILEMIGNVFDKAQSYSLNSRSHLSIIHPSKFDRYFAYSLPEGNLSEVQFGSARVSSQEDFNSQITGWVQKGYEYELQERFTRIKSFDNRQDFEKIIRAIFHLANGKSQQQFRSYKRHRI